MLLTGLVVLVMLGSLAYAYLEIATSAAAWPPSGAPDPRLAWPLLACAAALAAAVGAQASARAARRGDLRRTATLLAAAIVPAVGFGVLAAVWLAGMGTTPTTDAYGSSVFTLVVFEILLAGALVLMLAVVAWQAARGALDASRHVSVRVTAVHASLVAGTWAVVAALVVVTPRVW